MNGKRESTLTASCRCGAVAFEATGAPIVSTACYCESCQEAGRRIEQLADAPPVLDADGGTAFILYRKDRVRCVHGGERLTEHRLKPDSPTRRMVSNCCNSAMFLEFSRGHWLTLYRDPPARGRATPGNARHDRGPPHGRATAAGRAQLRRPFGKIHVEADFGLGRDGLSRAQGSRRAGMTARTAAKVAMENPCVITLPEKCLGVGQPPHHQPRGQTLASVGTPLHAPGDHVRTQVRGLAQ